MNTREYERQWCSLHVGFTGSLYSTDCDAVVRWLSSEIVDVLREEQLVQKAFFIRYAEHGSHVRLRMLPPSENESIACRDLTDTAIALLNTNVHERITSISEVRYEPEFDRYGGPICMSLTENLFDQSSCSAWSDVGSGDFEVRPRRLGRAALHQLISLYGLLESRSDIQPFLNGTFRGYLQATARSQEMVAAALAGFAEGAELVSDQLNPYVEAVWSILDHPEELPHSLASYLRGCQVYRREVAQLGGLRPMQFSDKPISGVKLITERLAASVIHMHNNRLGISIPDEILIAYLLSNALSVIHV